MRHNEHTPCFPGGWKHKEDSSHRNSPWRKVSTRPGMGAVDRTRSWKPLYTVFTDNQLKYNHRLCTYKSGFLDYCVAQIKSVESLFIYRSTGFLWQPVSGGGNQ